MWWDDVYSKRGPDQSTYECIRQYGDKVLVLFVFFRLLVLQWESLVFFRMVGESRGRANERAARMRAWMSLQSQLGEGGKG